MRWKTPMPPKVGDTKFEFKFAFFPKELDTGYTVWLEKYIVCLKLMNNERFPDYVFDPYEWVVIGVQ